MTITFDGRRLAIGIGAIAILIMAGFAGYYVRDAVRPSAVENASAGKNAADGLPKGYTRLPVCTFGNWNLSCVRSNAGVKKCDLFLRLADRTSKRLLLSLIIAQAGDKKEVFDVVTPPNVVLAEGVSISASSSLERKIAFSNCKPGFCEAILPLDASLAAGLRSANTLSVAYLSAAGKKIAYAIPVNGYGAGYDAWQQARSSASVRGR